MSTPLNLNYDGLGHTVRSFFVCVYKVDSFPSDPQTQGFIFCIKLLSILRGGYPSMLLFCTSQLGGMLSLI